ncbi:MAG: hypothetical protein O3B13_10775 [Planctomycetota bacterium]|nr:hypothetical protein [Planctomycetota bacterium]MDA1163576.1 hypothetical protein [Planctomycetota bacterium]
MLAAFDGTEIAFWVWSLCIVAWLLSAARQQPVSGKKKLRRLEAKVDAIIQHLGIELSEEMMQGGLSEEVKRLADTGQKIAAIKLHREEATLGLKETKDDVESYLGG